jgi:hypothetical protein
MMATITYTSRYSGLDNWPGRLLQATDDTTIVTRTATQMVIRHGADSDFNGYRLIFTGTGFTYQNGVAVDGTVSQLRIVDGGGNTVLTFAGLASNPIGGDLAQIVSDILGSPFDDAGPGPDGQMARWRGRSFWAATTRSTGRPATTGARWSA